MLAITVAKRRRDSNLGPFGDNLICSSVLRSGDRNSGFIFGGKPTGRSENVFPDTAEVEPEPDRFKQLRKETEEQNRLFLLSVFNRVSKDVS